jgi:hypothetical protein
MFHLSRWHIATTMIATLFGGPSNAQSTTGAPSAVVPVGCYRLTLGPWSKESNLGPAQSTTIVRLDTMIATPGEPGDRVADRVEPAQFAPAGGGGGLRRDRNLVHGNRSRGLLRTMG